MAAVCSMSSKSMPSIESVVVLRRCVAVVAYLDVCLDVVGSCTEREMLLR